MRPFELIWRQPGKRRMRSSVKSVSFDECTARKSQESHEHSWIIWFVCERLLVKGARFIDLPLMFAQSAKSVVRLRSSRIHCSRDHELFFRLCRLPRLRKQKSRLRMQPRIVAEAQAFL